MHHEEYLHKLDDLTLPGCFGMTELGHGSNVMGIETTATYDKAAQEFIINTPSDEASKYWIGGAAQHGKVSKWRVLLHNALHEPEQCP
jgi:acyl-CoA oxidase